MSMNLLQNKLITALLAIALVLGIAAEALSIYTNYYLAQKARSEAGITEIQNKISHTTVDALGADRATILERQDQTRTH